MSFSHTLLSWYKEHKRDLPWRYDPNPYEVVVSEIMLQQTQVSRVKIKYCEFLDAYPTIFDLAKASSADIIQIWSGMGYNRRALMLHKFAQVVVKEHNGIIPQTPEELIKLPGIGPYAAGSIASFAYNLPAPAIDVNVRRIFHRFFDGRDQGKPGSKDAEKELFALVQKTIPDTKSSEFHNALMDFGSLVCLRSSPICQSCPMKECSFRGKYLEHKSDALFVMEKKKEPGRPEKGKHIPNRIFRGRIVEYVRQNKTKEIAFSDFGSVVKKDYTSKDQEWLLSLVEKLAGEGFIMYARNKDLITFDLVT